MSKGIVVDHKESGVRYAVSEKNFNEKVHKKVRDLKPGETVQGFQPKTKESLEKLAEAQPALFGENELVETPETAAETPVPAATPSKTK